MRIRLHHDDYVEMVRILMWHITGKDFINTHKCHHAAPVPDLKSVDGRVCVEVGDLRSNYNDKGRIEALLGEYEQVWWFCQPSDVEKMPILFTNIFLFKRGQDKFSEEAELFRLAQERFKKYQTEQLEKVWKKENTDAPVE